MKITVVPAQVTTVEDRIIGNLSFSQMLLLIIPVFVGGALFGLLPPFMEGALYKYMIMGILAFICCLLAIRIKGRILASWVVTILRYNIRPKYYLFNKNVSTLRQDYPPTPEAKREVARDLSAEVKNILPRLNSFETAKILATIENPAARVRFETTKKGGLNVCLTEIED